MAGPVIKFRSLSEFSNPLIHPMQTKRGRLGKKPVIRVRCLSPKEVERNIMSSVLIETPVEPTPPPRRSADGTANVEHLNTGIASEIVQVFKLLADDTRVQIIYFLMQRKELNVGTICRLLHQSQPAVSHHLALLRESGMVDMRREGKHNFYRLVPKKIQNLRTTIKPIEPALERLLQSNSDS